MKIFKNSLISAFLFALVLAACRPSSPITTSGTGTPAFVKTATKDVTPTLAPTSQPTIGIQPDELKGIEIELWHGWDPTLTRVIADQVNTFNQTNSWGIFTRVVNWGGELELNAEVVKAAADGTLPEIIAAPSSNLASFQVHGVEWVDQNIYANSADWGLTPDQVLDFYSTIWNADQLDGFRFGFPAYRSMQVMYYNQGWAQELGFGYPPKDANEFSNQACTAALANNKDSNNSNDGTGGWIIETGADTALNWLAAFGFSPTIQSDSQVLRFSSAVGEEAFQFVRKLSDDGCAWNPREQKPEEYLLNRNAIFYSARLEDLLTLQKTSLLLKSADIWTILPFPGTSGKPSVLISGDSYAIRKTSPIKQLASWLFIRWLAQPANLAAVVKATASLPLLKSEVPMLKDFVSIYPDWSKAVSWIDNAGIEPVNGEWLVEKQVLQDAFWQSLLANKTTKDIPDILKQADATVLEILAAQK